MTDTITKLMESNLLRVFNEPDVDRRTAAIVDTYGFGYLAWSVVAPGSDEPIVSGFDVALISDDRITDLFTVVTAAPG